MNIEFKEMIAIDVLSEHLIREDNIQPFSTSFFFKFDFLAHKSAHQTAADYDVALSKAILVLVMRMVKDHIEERDIQ